MSRSIKDSDDESKATGRMQTRMLIIQSEGNLVKSPLRRSSRIKQNKCSPGSESDSSSISSIQSITQSARTQTATMDSTVSDTVKKLRTRKNSISSEISEIDVEIPQTPGKRITRQSLGAASLSNTPTRINTRASKRFMRAGSETKSPLPVVRTTRKTRASSIDPESLSGQNKSQSSSPIKTRKQTSVFPSSSQIKRQIDLDDCIPYIRLDSTIVEADEITNSEKVEISTETSSKLNESLQLSEKKDETQTEDMNKETIKDTENTFDKEQNKFEKTSSSDKDTAEEFSTYSLLNCRNSAKEDMKIVKSFSDIEKSSLDICESAKEIEVIPENLSETIEKQKSDKENRSLNVVSDTVEKSMQSKVTPVKSLATPFKNKSLSEMETKSVRKEQNLNKRRHSNESIEIAVKHSDLSKEVTDSLQEERNISIESINSTGSDKTILIHDSIEVVDNNIMIIDNKNEISIESTNASTCNEDATEIISESDKIDKEYTVTDNKNSNKMELNELNKTSCSSIDLVMSTQINNSRESLTSILTTDDNNEIKLVLEEQSPRKNENEVSSNVTHLKPDQSVDLQISSPIDKNSADLITVMNKQLTQDKVIYSFDSMEQEQENLSQKHGIKSTIESFNTIMETNSAHDNSNDVIIEDNQSIDIIEASKKSTMDILSEKTDSKDILSEKTKRNKRKSTDNLEEEKESSQMEMIQKTQENMDVADDINIGIDLFQDVPADKWTEKNDVKISSVQSTSQSVEDVENENEVDCDLILMDKQAWLAAETIKAAKEAESFEYDSDDTVLLKSRLDASQANYDIEELVIVDEEPMDIDNEENKKVKKRKSRTKKRLVSEIDEDFSRCTENEDNLILDKSLNKSRTTLNRSNDRSISKLNKSEQLAKIRKRFSKASNESDEEIEDANELNRSSLIDKNNVSLRKSIKERTSLNKSLKDLSMQNISLNKSQMDNSEKELDDTIARSRKILYKKKHSLNISCNENANIDNAIESEKKNVSTEDFNKKHEDTFSNHSTNQKSKPINTRKTIHLSDHENESSDISIVAADFESKTYSMIANVGSVSDPDEIPRYLFKNASVSDTDSSSDDDSSRHSDINREYNLDGVEPKFSDEDIAGDECRASEVEFSDSDDNGSDLADFIIEDQEEEEEEKDDEEDDEEDEDKDDDDAQHMKDEDDDENIQKEKVEDGEEKTGSTELLNMENENEKDDEDVQKKDAVGKKDANKNKFVKMETTSLHISTNKPSKIQKSNKSIEHISPHRSEIEIKQDIKMKKNEKSILDSSNSDLSKKKKKKKSLIKEDELILLDSPNLISSTLKKKRILDSQYSSKDGTEKYSSEQLNEFKSTSAKRLSKSCTLMEFSTPDLNSCKKLELDERLSENEDNTKGTQNISIKDKSKKDLTLNKDVTLKKFSDASEKKMLNSDFSADLLKMLEKPSLSKLSKIESRKSMNIDIESPRLKYLRKEKLNESAPALKYTETNMLQEQLSTEKDITQIKIKEKNKDKVPDLIISSDDAIQKRSQKKQKKRKRQESSNKSMTNEDVSPEDIIKLNVPKKKKIKLTQLTVVKDNSLEDVNQIGEKKKKNKKQDTLNENIDEILLKTSKTKKQDVIDLNVPKKKKIKSEIKLPIIEDNTNDYLYQINKRKKEQNMLIEHIIQNYPEILSKDTMKLKNPKKKNDKLTQLAIVEDDINEDVCQIKKKKKKKPAKLIQSPIVEDDIHEDVCQINKKKKKKQNTSKEENIIDKALSKDVIESKSSKKKELAKLIQLHIVEENTREDECQINEKKKKKKKQINIIEEDTNVNKDNMFEKYIRGNKTELTQHKKKSKVINNLELNSLADKQEKQVKKKIKQQELIESIENLRTEKKKKKKDILPVQIPVSKFKSEKILLSNELQKATLNMSESKNVACNTKKLKKAVHAAEISEESKSKKKRNRIENVENAINVPTKKLKKEITEESKPSSSGLKRLPDDVIKNLEDVPTKAKKISRNKKKVTSPVTTRKSKVTTADHDGMLTLNPSDCTTQFHVVNLQDTKKQSSKKAAASFRQRMLDRNNREHISTYMMFCEKMRHAK